MGEFEFALVFYHRGQKLCPKQQEFRQGIQKAEEAIENAIARLDCIDLDKVKDLSCLQDTEANTSTPSGAVRPVMMEKSQQSEKTSKRERTEKQLLGEFYSDSKFLKNLLKEKEKQKALQTEASQQDETMVETIKSSLAFLEKRSMFWHQQRPLSVRDRDRKLKMQKEPKPFPSDPNGFLLKSLDEISEALTCGSAAGGLKKATDMIQTVEEWSEEMCPDKKEVLGRMHNCIGDILVDVGDLEKALKHHEKALDFAQQGDLPDVMSKALDYIGYIYVHIGKLAKAIESWEKKLPLVQTPMEEMWLCHEIGRCYYELKCYKEARDYGVCSLGAADDTNDETSKINANALVAQSERYLENFESSVPYFERALYHAQTLTDHSAIAGIQKALKEVKKQLKK